MELILSTGVVFQWHSYLGFSYIFMQSAKTNMNVEEVFFSIARDIKQRLAESDSKAEVLVSNL